MLIAFFIFYIIIVALEYYRLWKHGQRSFKREDLKEIDSAQIIRQMVKKEQKCGMIDDEIKGEL